MTNSTETTLGALVTETPGAARVFERRGLDYCCGGGRTIDEACATGGIDPNDVLDELSKLTEEPRAEWTSMMPSELVDHLESTHHKYLSEELPRLSALAARIEGVHGERHPELTNIRVLFDTLRAELEPHLLKEERILFPMIRQLDGPEPSAEFHCGSVGNPIRVMCMEHDHAGELLAKLRQLTGGYDVPADGCTSYNMLYTGMAELEADTHLHIHIENNLLFPAAIELEGSRRTRQP